MASLPVSASLSRPPVLPSFNIKTCVTVELGHSNYLLWKTQFVPFLKSQNLWGFIDGSMKAPPETFEDGTRNPGYDKWLQTDQLILSWINTTLSEECLRHVVGLATAEEAWNELEHVYNFHHTGGSRSTPRARTGTETERAETDSDGAWRNSVKANLNSISCSDQPSQLPTIIRVPSCIRKIDPEAYDPQILSIGPYHRRENKLKAMEKNKRKYLHDLLSRNTTVSLDAFLDDMQSKAQEARNCYTQEDLQLSSNEFLEMMVLDGCFIVELLLKFKEKSCYYSFDPIFSRSLVLHAVTIDLILVENQLPFFVLSHIFDTYGKVKCPSDHSLPLDKLAMNFLRDVVKYEITESAPVRMESTHHLVHLLHKNLIPPLPLQLSTQSHNSLLTKVKNILLSTCSHLLPICRPESSNDQPFQPFQPSQPSTPSHCTLLPKVKNILLSTCLHLLPICRPESSNDPPSQPESSNDQPSQPSQPSTQCHYSLLPKVKSILLSTCSHLLLKCRPESSNDQPSQPFWNIPTIQRLQEAGVKFRKGEGPSFLDIKFKKGVMEIPYVDIDDFTNTFLRNMIAYEQINSHKRPCFTIYTTLMDNLINTAKDVEELTYHGIIDNSLGSHEDVTVLFNKIGKGILLPWDDDHMKLVEEVNRYCSSKPHMWRAKLAHDYFSNPWAIFSLIGALLVLILTFLQTLFSYLSYVHPPSSS